MACAILFGGKSARKAPEGCHALSIEPCQLNLVDVLHKQQCDLGVDRDDSEHLQFVLRREA